MRNAPKAKQPHTNPAIIRTGTSFFLKIQWPMRPPNRNRGAPMEIIVFLPPIVSDQPRPPSEQADSFEQLGHVERR